MIPNNWPTSALVRGTVASHKKPIKNENAITLYSEIGKNITEAKNGVETYMVDANYTDSDTTEYLGKVCYEDEEYAKEDGFVEIDTYALEDDIINEKGDCVAKEKEVKPLDDLKNILNENSNIQKI